MASGWDSKDVIELLQRTLLGLWQEQEYQNKRRDVHPSVKSESASSSEGGIDSGERDRQYGSPEKASGDSPGHADLAVGKREDLSRVGEL